MARIPHQATLASGHRVASFCTGSDADLKQLAAALRAGELVAIPTETVYGLAAHALDEQACRRIFEVKGRPLLDPLIVHVTGLEQALKLGALTEHAARLIEHFWPGPLTLVVRKHACVPDLVTAGRPTVALRSPAHPLARRLLQFCDFPLAAPSANPFGYISPTTARHVAESLGTRIPYILDGGPCSIGVESTIVELTGPLPRLLRPGSITSTQLEAALGCPVVAPSKPEGPQEIEAPGMLARHYSPRTPLKLFPPGVPPATGADEALVFQGRPSGNHATAPHVHWLSECGDGAEAGRNLYALLRQLDESGYRKIHFERASGHALAATLNDRLQRAAAS